MKRIIIVVIVMITLVVTTLFVLNKLQARTNEEPIKDKVQLDEEIEIKEETKEGLKLLDNANESYTIYRILKSYNLYLNYLDFDVSKASGIVTGSDTEIKEEYKKEGIKILAEIIDLECQEKYYKKENDIYNKLKKYANTDMNIEEIYIVENNNNIKKYIVKLVSNEYIAIKMDSENNTFTIFTNEFFEDVEEINLVKINNDSIGKQNYNTYINEKIDEQGLINEYFGIYHNAVSNNMEDAFLLLNKEYKEEKFVDVAEYKKFIENNYKQVKLDKYKIYKYGDKKHYVCIDNESNYSVFIEERPFSFSVLLDTYTVNIPEFVEKYDKADDMEKVAYNIEKLIFALNNKDYKYIYSKMDNTFKANNFPNLEDFEKASEDMFWDNNKIEYKEYNNKGDVHIYTINLKDLDEEGNDIINEKQIYMKLKEDYDFVFSFNLENN